MCSHAHVNKWIMVHFQPRTHIQWLIHSIASPYCQHSADRKQSYHKCLRRRSRNQILSNQRQNWVSVWLFFLMPEFDGTATKRTCVDVSDVLIHVASDRSDHQCCGSGKIARVLVISIIVVLVLVSFCWIILVII